MMNLIWGEREGERAARSAANFGCRLVGMILVIEMS